MEEKIVEIINTIRTEKGLLPLPKISKDDDLRQKLELTSFDLAELTVIIEDQFGVDIFEKGLISTVGEIYSQLRK